MSKMGKSQHSDPDEAVDDGVSGMCGVRTAHCVKFVTRNHDSQLIKFIVM